MKRLASVAFLLLVALGAQAHAGPLPKPTSLVDRHKASNVTHYVRADQKLPRAVGLESRDRHRTVRQTHYVRGK